VGQGWVQLVAGPEAEPVTEAQCKAFCRFTLTAEDSLFTAWITENRKRAERVTGKGLLLQTWSLTLDRFPPSGPIELPNAYPLASVESVTYRDVPDGDEVVLASSEYVLEAYRMPGRIAPVRDGDWPDAYEDDGGSVVIEYTAGYVGTADDLAELKGRLLVAVAHCWRRREDRDEQYLDNLFASLWNGRF
jgi:uncharacterized phiE125 gp8 family phage protein